MSGLPRYTMRTLFIVMTVLAVFIAYHANWIRQRRAVVYGKKWSFCVHLPETVEHKAPGLLWLFGERGYDRILLFANMSWSWMCP